MDPDPTFLNHGSGIVQNTHIQIHYHVLLYVLVFNKKEKRKFKFVWYLAEFETDYNLDLWKLQYIITFIKSTTEL